LVSNYQFIVSEQIVVTHFASTLPKPHKPTRKAKLCQRACKADPRRNSFFSSHPSVFYFFTNARPKTDKHTDSSEHKLKGSAT
jgi:hypothetical protein